MIIKYLICRDSAENGENRLIFWQGDYNFSYHFTIRLMKCVHPNKFTFQIFVVDMISPIDTIRDCIKEIEIHGKIDCLILPMIKETAYQEYTRYTEKEFIKRKKEISSELDIPVLELFNDKSGLDDLYKLLTKSHTYR